MTVRYRHTQTGHEVTAANGSRLAATLEADGNYEPVTDDTAAEKKPKRPSRKK